MAGSHSRTVPSPSALASSVPLGLNATPDTPFRVLVALSGAPMERPVAGCHSRTVPSPSALASSVPSGLNATPNTPRGLEPVCSAPTGRPVAGSHSRTVPSPPALASSLPSGLNATPNTPPAGPEPACIADAAAGGRVPQPHRAVAAGAGQQPAAGAERHRRHAVSRAGAGLQHADGAAGSRVPQPHRAVAAGAGQQPAAGAERHRAYTPLRALAWSGAPTGRRAAGSHSRTVPSPPALASSLPPGLNATANTPPLGPEWVGMGAPAGSMPCCCCSASRVVMAESAWPVGETAQAATASRRERLRGLWYRLRLTVAEMNYATRRTVELQAPWISDDHPSH